MKNIFVVLLFLLVSPAYSQLQELEKAYKNKSLVGLNTFFETWRNNVPPISEYEFQNLSDTIKEAYKVFESFYHPLNLAEIGGVEWKENIYNDANYLIIQPMFTIRIQDKVYFSKEDAYDINEQIKSNCNKDEIDSIKFSHEYLHEDWSLIENHTIIRVIT